MTDKNYTDITLLLDRSGSMSDIWKDTIGGIDSFLAQQKQLPGKALFTLYTFDTVVDHVVQAKPIAEASRSDLNGVAPRGSTALYDALVRSVAETGSRLAALPKSSGLVRSYSW